MNQEIWQRINTKAGARGGPWTWRNLRKGDQLGRRKGWDARVSEESGKRPKAQPKTKTEDISLDLLQYGKKKKEQLIRQGKCHSLQKKSKGKRTEPKRDKEPN